jgi:hypothetical protein
MSLAPPPAIFTPPTYGTPPGAPAVIFSPAAGGTAGATPSAISQAYTSPVLGTRQELKVSFTGDPSADSSGTIQVIPSTTRIDPSATGDVFVNVDSGMTPAQIAAATRAALANQEWVTDFFDVLGTGLDVILRFQAEAANDISAAIIVQEGTAQLSGYPTSTITVAGSAGGLRSPTRSFKPEIPPSTTSAPPAIFAA